MDEPENASPMDFHSEDPSPRPCRVPTGGLSPTHALRLRSTDRLPRVLTPAAAPSACVATRSTQRQADGSSGPTRSGGGRA
jgi:hypothetical protein